MTVPICVRHTAAVLAGLVLSTVSLAAGDTAYVNMEVVFEGYYKTVRANAAFEQKKDDFEERVALLREELKGMVEEAKKLEAEADNELLSQEARDNARRGLRLRVERLRAKEEEFQQFQRSGMRDLNRNRVKAEQELIDDITQYVRTFCRNKGFRLVYDINGRSLNRIPVLLLYPEEDEVTAEILTEINRGHEEELAKAKAELEELRKDDKGDGDDEQPPAAGDGAGGGE
ncbi:MAG: OmpH family outer membrane protein [Lentisphaeria bacterium]|nr:OmpH family outer membrane protein [Lentisphaeria bacterium]